MMNTMKQNTKHTNLRNLLLCVLSFTAMTETNATVADLNAAATTLAGKKAEISAKDFLKKIAEERNKKDNKDGNLEFSDTDIALFDGAKYDEIIKVLDADIKTAAAAREAINKTDSTYKSADDKVQELQKKKDDFKGDKFI